MRAAVALLVFALPLVAVGAPVPKAKKTTEDKLIGKWRMVTSDTDTDQPKGYEFYVVFKEKGEFELRREYGGIKQNIVWSGTFKVLEGDKIDYSVTINNRVKTEVLTITELTDDKVGWTDPDNLKEALERVKEEKKDK